MTLELKHLAPYLPYDLKFKAVYKASFNIDPDIVEIETLSCSNINIFFRKRYGLKSAKPILRPLSDLTKEIEFNNNTFVPAILLWQLSAKEEDDFELYGDIPELWKNALKLNFERDFDYWIMTNLFKMHFDVFGLIEKGLAIDINQLNEQK